MISFFVGAIKSCKGNQAALILNPSFWSPNPNHGAVIEFVSYSWLPANLRDSLSHRPVVDTLGLWSSEGENGWRLLHLWVFLFWRETWDFGGNLTDFLTCPHVTSWWGWACSFLVYRGIRRAWRSQQQGQSPGAAFWIIASTVLCTSVAKSHVFIYFEHKCSSLGLGFSQVFWGCPRGMQNCRLFCIKLF